MTSNECNSCAMTKLERDAALSLLDDAVKRVHELEAAIRAVHPKVFFLRPNSDEMRNALGNLTIVLIPSGGAKDRADRVREKKI